MSISSPLLRIRLAARLSAIRRAIIILAYGRPLPPIRLAGFTGGHTGRPYSPMATPYGSLVLRAATRAARIRLAGASICDTPRHHHPRLWTANQRRSTERLCHDFARLSAIRRAAAAMAAPYASAPAHPQKISDHLYQKNGPFFGPLFQLSQSRRFL